MWKLWWRLSRNEVRRRYRRTLLGPSWVTLSLIIFAIVLSFVWAGLWNQNVRDYLPFLLSGLLPWGMISASLSDATGSFLSGEGLMKSRQFPYTMLLLLVLSRNVLLFGHNLVGYILIALATGVTFGWATLLIIPGFVIVLLNLGWLCLIIAIFCLRFRDFQQLITTFLQVAMFITPVFWSASQLQGKRSIIADGNLLFHMIEIIREPLLNKSPTFLNFTACVGSAVLGWGLAFWMFSRKRHRLAYWF